MKFKLKCDQYGESEIVHKFDEVFLPNIVANFRDFLKGCGFQFEDLEIINKEDEE